MKVRWVRFVYFLVGSSLITIGMYLIDYRIAFVTFGLLLLLDLYLPKKE